MRKITLLTIALLAMTLVGCSEYHADIPEYTTSSDRDTGFAPKLEEHLPVSTDNEDLNNRVRQGFKDVEEKAASYSEEIDEKAFGIESNSADMEDNAREMKSGLDE